MHTGDFVLDSDTENGPVTLKVAIKDDFTDTIDQLPSIPHIKAIELGTMDPEIDFISKLTPVIIIFDHSSHEYLGIWTTKQIDPTDTPVHGSLDKIFKEEYGYSENTQALGIDVGYFFTDQNDLRYLIYPFATEMMAVRTLRTKFEELMIDYNIYRLCSGQTDSKGVFKSYDSVIQINNEKVLGIIRLSLAMLQFAHDHTLSAREYIKFQSLCKAYYNAGFPKSWMDILEEVRESTNGHL